MRHPTSVQCGNPAGDPLYPVARILRSRTITAPTLARRQVERSATCRVIVMKYWSQLGRFITVFFGIPAPRPLSPRKPADVQPHDRPPVYGVSHYRSDPSAVGLAAQTRTALG